MTQARHLTVAEGQQAFYHCITRCVRRAWLCGIDPITEKLRTARESQPCGQPPERAGSRSLSENSDTTFSVRLTDTRIGDRNDRHMTQARHLTVAEGQQAFYHCVTRCVRRAWLCGIDPITKVDYEHRKPMIAARIVQLAGIFAVDVYSYAVMSNHLHVVLSVEPSAARDWTEEQVAQRWVQLFPAREPEQNAAKISALIVDKNALEERRKRLADLSWYMRCLDEHIARKANAEDDVTGRFWEGLRSVALAAQPPDRSKDRGRSRGPGR